MKQGIHPTYYEDAVVICSCGNTWTTGSTKKEIHTDVCSACHPFFTGEQRIVDTAGQVERFMRRLRTKDEIRAQARIKAEARKLAEEAGRKAKARGEDAEAAYDEAYQQALAKAN
jgi:large subunit ribosomal protein L31